MLTISQDQFGGPEVLHPVEIDRPAPGLGEILVRVHAAGVNPVDVMNRETGVLVGDPPFVLGWDVSGTVEADRLGMTTLAALVSQGDLVPTVAATYPLSAAGRAQATKCGPGKTVLLVADHI
ncbi:alcohol dehydrogenase catalytic domain-containing protein [Mycobacterium sp. ENV421]|uniref:alcohol dehydrogenase catalytic domain-containing protein n=1 Tax=Mycobacterium sp. ENV421 TaxID=1213407 RepID=UPI001E569498|nr:alcohol dehydrogenase catalytic domain-containing protein [Mycobacterium sp. ENV421]